MKTIQISVTREEIFARVSRQMDWEGSRGRQGDKEYPRLAISDADTSLINSFFDEAAMHAIDICRPMLRSVVNSDQGLTLELALSDNAAASVEDSLRPILFNMLSSKVLALWQEIVTPEKASGANLKHTETESKFQAALYHHPAPIRQV